jgi:hypothetical protein
LALLHGSVGIRRKPWISDRISQSKEVAYSLLVVAGIEQTAVVGAPNPAAGQTISLKLPLDGETSSQTKEVLYVMTHFVGNDHGGTELAKPRHLLLHESRFEIDASVQAAIERFTFP